MRIFSKPMQCVLLLIILLPVICYSQTQPSDSVILKAEAFQNVTDSSVLSINCDFLITKNQVKWIQYNGDVSKEYHFSILRNDGNWESVEQGNPFRILVSDNSNNGVLKIEKIVDTYFVVMEFIRDGKNIMPYKFKIKSIVR